MEVRAVLFLRMQDLTLEKRRHWYQDSRRWATNRVAHSCRGPEYVRLYSNLLLQLLIR